MMPFFPGKDFIRESFTEITSGSATFKLSGCAHRNKKEKPTNKAQHKICFIIHRFKAKHPEDFLGR